MVQKRIQYFNIQYPLLSAIERWRLCTEKQGFTGVLLMNLSKVFDAINHKLVIAKLQYEFSTEAPEVLLSYPQERWPSVKINTTPWTQSLQII